MKYDEKTGKKIPENRMDEVAITLKNLQDLDEKCHGLTSPAMVTNTLLNDISVSLALLVDITGSIFNRMIKAEKNASAEPSDKAQ